MSDEMAEEVSVNESIDETVSQLAALASPRWALVVTCMNKETHSSNLVTFYAPGYYATRADAEVAGTSMTTAAISGGDQPDIGYIVVPCGPLA